MIQAACQAAHNGVAKVLITKPRPAKPIHVKVLWQHALIVQCKERGVDLLLGQVPRGTHHHDAQTVVFPVFWLQAIHLHIGKAGVGLSERGVVIAADGGGCIDGDTVARAWLT